MERQEDNPDDYLDDDIGKHRNVKRGPQYEIACIKNVIVDKEARGMDASYERELLKAWAKHPGYEGAKQALASCGKPPVTH